MQIRKAERRKAKLRLALVAPSGAGKTYSALQMAFGIGGKVGMIDTENGSGDLYADVGEYDIITLQEPFTIKKYLEAIKAFEKAGYDTIIIDSLTHAWAGTGGLLDKQGKMADGGGSSYVTWRKITPEHNSLVDAMLQSPAHIIATIRAKTDYVQEKDDKGKTVVRKVGLAPVQRDGLEYEFTVVMDIDASHVASASKDRTRQFTGEYFKITEKTGEQLLNWLNQGVDAPILNPEPEQKEETQVRDQDRRPMPDDEYQTFSDKINAAATIDDLAKAFKEAQDAGRQYGDKPAVEGFAKLKDLRKTELTTTGNK